MELQVLAWLAVTLNLWSFALRTMVPLRRVAIAGNLAFVAWGLLAWRRGGLEPALPIAVLHAALLIVNLVRLRQVRATIEQVRSLQGRPPPLDALLPYMTPVRLRGGETLFRAGDPADAVYLLRSGVVHLPEVPRLLGPGALLGEVGVLAGHQRRTASVVCKEDCEFFRIDGARVVDLLCQDPQFGFLLVKTMAHYQQPPPPTEG
jgi:hypothetical protein